MVTNVASCWILGVNGMKCRKVHKVPKEKNKFVWIGLHEPSEDILSQVQVEFGLHDLAVEDAHTAHQRPKLELFGDSIFVVMPTAQINS